MTTASEESWYEKCARERGSSVTNTRSEHSRGSSILEEIGPSVQNTSEGTSWPRWSRTTNRRVGWLSKGTETTFWWVCERGLYTHQKRSEEHTSELQPH